jgi:hypothetical protein
MQIHLLTFLPSGNARKSWRAPAATAAVKSLLFNLQWFVYDSAHDDPARFG